MHFPTIHRSMCFISIMIYILFLFAFKVWVVPVHVRLKRLLYAKIEKKIHLLTVIDVIYCFAFFFFIIKYFFLSLYVYNINENWCWICMFYIHWEFRKVYNFFLILYFLPLRYGFFFSESVYNILEKIWEVMI